jgi:hypothetical protein
MGGTAKFGWGPDGHSGLRNFRWEFTGIAGIIAKFQLVELNVVT